MNDNENRHRQIDGAEYDQRQGFINWREVTRLTTLTRSTLFLMIDAGDFPAPFRISERRMVFVKAEVLEWIENKITQRA